MRLLLSLLAATRLTSFPVVDLEVWRRGSRAEQDALAKFVDETCRKIGFFVIVNHDVSEKKIKSVWRETKRYFDKPLKEKVPLMTDDYPFGYSPLGGEDLAKGAGAKGIGGDYKEMFAVGPYDPMSGVPAPRYPDDRKFETAWHAYYQEMESLAVTLLGLFARALKLPDDWFHQFIDHHACALRALNYPPLSNREMTDDLPLRASAHTDYGSLTILRSGGPGLQVKNRSSQVWIDVPYLPTSHFVINLGDLMNRWTNNRWLSTPHRVVFLPSSSSEQQQQQHGPLHFLRRFLFRQRPNGRRQSLAFFHNLNYDANVTAIETCLDPGEQPIWPPILAHDHLMEKHRAATRGVQTPMSDRRYSDDAPAEEL